MTQVIDQQVAIRSLVNAGYTKGVAMTLLSKLDVTDQYSSLFVVADAIAGMDLALMVCSLLEVEKEDMEESSTVLGIMPATNLDHLALFCLDLWDTPPSFVYGLEAERLRQHRSHLINSYPSAIAHVVAYGKSLQFRSCYEHAHYVLGLSKYEATEWALDLMGWRENDYSLPFSKRDLDPEKLKLHIASLHIDEAVKQLNRGAVDA